MHMDVSRSARDFSMKVLVVLALAITCAIVLSSFSIGSTSSGLPTIFGDLTFRLFGLEEGWLQIVEGPSPTRDNVRRFGGVLLIFVFLGSKATIISFIYHCKLLQSAFAYWNGRVYASVLRGGEFAQTQEGRTTYKLLFRDHCVLMDLMEGMDQVFAFSLESYFGCQIVSLFFELYFCIRTAKHGSDQDLAANPTKNGHAFYIRPYDWAPGLLMMTLSVIIMYTAAKSAAGVAEEAIAGLEVLRRRTMLGRRTDDELYFMLSMFSSYTAYKKLEISGGGYSYLNKDFLLGLVSAVLSYFIILYQFQPVMDISYALNGDQLEIKKRVKFGVFLSAIEGLDELHYLPTEAPGDVWERFRHNITAHVIFRAQEAEGVDEVDYDQDRDSDG